MKKYNELLVIINWNHIFTCKLLVLDMNTWNYLCANKLSLNKNSYFKPYNCEYLIGIRLEYIYNYVQTNDYKHIYKKYNRTLLSIQ